MAKYLVTGGCGFIGSHLVERLLQSGNEVIVLDDLSTGRRENIFPHIPLRVGSVTNCQLVSELIAEVDGCFHLAAVASVEKSHKDWLGSHHVNQGGTLAILVAASKSPTVPVPVVYASSAAVYGDNPDIPLAEDSQTVPLSAYGVDKLGSELHAKIAGAVHGVPNVGFRFFNVYGPRQDPKSPYSGVISIFAERIRQQLPITIYGNGEQTRDFVYVTDVVECLLAGMRKVKKDGSIYNVCSGRPTSVNQLTQALGAIVGVRPNVSYAPTRAGDIYQSLGNPVKAADMLGVSCKTPLDDGLRSTLAWMKEANYS